MFLEFLVPVIYVLPYILGPILEVFRERSLKKRVSDSGFICPDARGANGIVAIITMFALQLQICKAFSQ